MCLLTFLPPGVQPDVEALFNGTFFNDDGHGYAIVTGGRLLVAHAMTSEALIEAFAAARRAHPDGPALFHSRFSTHGALHDLANCHPIALGGDTRTVIAHNGVLPTTVQPVAGDPRSDTRIAADVYLPAAFGSLRLRRTRRRVERWMGPDNKMVLLSVDRRYRDNAYILNEQEGIWDGGIWYSNNGYQPDIRFADPYDRWHRDDPTAWRRDTGEVGHCGNCHALIGLADDQCPICGGCPGCGEAFEDCFCYQPAVLAHRPPPTRRTDAA